MEKTDLSNWHKQISDFIGEYISYHPECSPLVLTEMLQKRFLITPGEAKKLAGIVENELNASRPFLAAIELNLTFNCNLACPYCFVRRKGSHDRMDAVTAQKAIDLLLDRAVVPDVTITLIGGEPLLEFKLIKQIVPYGIEAARRRNLHINWTITTNGTLLDEQILKYFAEHQIYILLSIDGWPEP